jgi:hypothetical protein
MLDWTKYPHGPNSPTPGWVEESFTNFDKVRAKVLELNHELTFSVFLNRETGAKIVCFLREEFVGF